MNCLCVIAQTFFKVWKYFIAVVSAVIIPDLLSNCAHAALFTSDIRPDTKTCKIGDNLDDKVACAGLFALSFPTIPTCEGIHAMIIDTSCNGHF